MGGRQVESPLVIVVGCVMRNVGLRSQHPQRIVDGGNIDISYACGCGSTGAVGRP